MTEEQADTTEQVRGYYQRLDIGEWNRFERPLQRIEFLSTLRLIDKYLPNQGEACDIGAGPGRYSVELLRRGLKVTLFDLSPNLLSIARDHIARAGLTASAFYTGDARDMSLFGDQLFDVVLVMGPLYHLKEPHHRIRVLSESRRIMRKGGRGLVAYLNGWGLIRTGITDFPSRYEDAGFECSRRAAWTSGIGLTR